MANASKPTIEDQYNLRMGSRYRISTNRKSSSYTHTLRYSFNGYKADIAKDVGEYYDWTIPDLASKCNGHGNGICNIYCATYNGKTLVGEEHISNLSISVPSITTAYSGDIYAGSTALIETPGKSSNFTHKLRYSIGALSGYITNDEVKSGAYWEVPYELASAIPYLVSTPITIICETYNGGPKLGETSTTVTFHVLENAETKPVVSGMDLSPYHSLNSQFETVFVQGYSKISAEFSGSSAYSQIDHYVLSVGGEEYVGNPARSLVMENSGEVSVTGYAVDKRGFYSAPFTKSVTIVPYSPPSATPATGYDNVLCERSDSDGTPNDEGIYLHIIAGRRYSKVMDGDSQKNFCQLRYRYKQEGASSYSVWIPLLNKSSEEDQVEVTLADIVPQIDMSYFVEISAVDDITESTGAYTFSIPTADVTFHLRQGGGGAAFGKYSTKVKTLECAWDADFEGDVSVDGKISSGGSEIDVIIEQGETDDGWEYKKYSSGDLECYKRSLEVVVFQDEFTSGLYSGDIGAEEFPVQFSSNPFCVVGVECSTPLVVITKSVGTSSSTQAISVAATARGQNQVAVTYIAKGRWK